jgi:hypothetical protein
VRLRIVRPLPAQLEDIDTSHFKFGASYNVQSPISDLLLADGYAVPDDFLAAEACDATRSERPRPRRRPRRRVK